MAAAAMANPIDKLKKIRSWDEIRTRGSQAVSAYTEKFGFGGHVPTDQELTRLVDRQQFGDSPVIAESIWLRFYSNADERFFPVFQNRIKSARYFGEKYQESGDRFIRAADLILDGRIDLLGLSNLYVGKEIDWHYEPVSGIRSPMKHWKEFDDLDADEAGDKKVIWELNRHQHFFKLGVAFWLTGDEKYTDAFVNHLESWMDQNPPGMGINWASSLEVSFRAISWIWAMQFFRHADRFSPELLRRAVKYLYLHGRHLEKYLSTYYSPNTHLTGEALGLYYLGTQLPFLERAEHWRTLGDRILSSEINKQIYDDGVYFEQSTWYQRYTVDFYNQFVILRSLGDPEARGLIGDQVETRLSVALDFMMHTTRPDGTTPLIGDDDGGRALPLTGAAPDDFRGTLAVGAAIFTRGDLKCVAGESIEDLFWLFGPEALATYRLIEEQEPELTSQAFRSGGYYSMRDGWLATDNHVLIDCGPVGSLAGGHGHADALGVEVSLQGRKLLVDAGTFSYHGSADVRDHFRSTQSHNTVSVDERSSSEPGSTFAWQTRSECTLGTWISDERFDYFAGSNDGYERLENPAWHERSVLLLKNDYIVIRDVVRAKGEHEYSLNYHFPVEAEIEVNEAEGFAGSSDWRMYVVGDGGVWQKRESWVSNFYGNKTNAPFLRFAASGRSTQEFFTFILPSEPGFDPPTVSEVQIEGGRAFAITYRAYTDMLMYSDDRKNAISTDLFDTRFDLTWARVGSREDTPEEYVLIGGTSFELNGREVIKDRGDLSFVTMRQIGRGLNLKSDRGRSRVSFS